MSVLEVDVSSFNGVLRLDQEVAVDALLPHDIGVLAATTAFGKTVVAARMIAERGVNLLVLVHRRQLMDQWVERLGAFLNAAPGMIGKIGGGKRKPSGRIDIALIQSLVRKGVVDDIVGDYGHLIVDECHHLSAVSFELVAKRTKARYVLGLSATVTRKDGHHPIIFMQCGPVRKRVDARTEAARRPFDHRVRIRQTAFRLPDGEANTATVPIQDVYRALTGDEGRNELIFNDVLAALEAGRSPVVITERTDHLEALADRLSRFAKSVVVLRGGQSERKRRGAMERLAAIPQQDERVIVATGRYLGEGLTTSAWTRSSSPCRSPGGEPWRSTPVVSTGFTIQNGRSSSMTMLTATSRCSPAWRPSAPQAIRRSAIRSPRVRDCSTGRRVEDYSKYAIFKLIDSASAGWLTRFWTPHDMDRGDLGSRR